MCHLTHMTNIHVHLCLCFKMEGLSSLQLANFLSEQGISQSVADAFLENEVTGKAFLALTELEVKELASKIGERVKLRELIKQCSKVSMAIGV